MKKLLILIILSLSLCYSNDKPESLKDCNPSEMMDYELRNLHKISSLLGQREHLTEHQYKELESLKKSYSSNSFTTPVFSGEYIEIILSDINPFVVSDEILKTTTISSIESFWDKNQFNTVHPPLEILEIDNKGTFGHIGQPRTLHLPIKLAGSMVVRIPVELKHQEEFIKKCLSYELAINGNIINYNAYLTLDQKFVPAEKSARIAGPHVDGLPRRNYFPYELDHSYIVSDNVPTKFYIHEFPEVVKSDLVEDNIWEVMSRSVKEDRIFNTSPYKIYLMNAYSVHTATKADVDVIRTFARLEFSKIEFDRIGNSKNPSFKYDWKYISRPIPINLK